jgi:hypothetical protein
MEYIRNDIVRLKTSLKVLKELRDKHGDEDVNGEISSTKFQIEREDRVLRDLLSDHGTLAGFLGSIWNRIKPQSFSFENKVEVQNAKEYIFAANMLWASKATQYNSDSENLMRQFYDSARQALVDKMSRVRFMDRQAQWSELVWSVDDTLWIAKHFIRYKAGCDLVSSDPVSLVYAIPFTVHGMTHHFLFSTT